MSHNDGNSLTLCLERISAVAKAMKSQVMRPWPGVMRGLEQEASGIVQMHSPANLILSGPRGCLMSGSVSSHFGAGCTVFHFVEYAPDRSPKAQVYPPLISQL